MPSPPASPPPPAPTSAWRRHDMSPVLPDRVMPLRSGPLSRRYFRRPRIAPRDSRVEGKCRVSVRQIYITRKWAGGAACDTIDDNRLVAQGAAHAASRPPGGGRRARSMVIPDPLDRHRALRLLLGLVLLVVFIYTVGLVWSALALFGDVILLFFLAWIVAFILEPVSILLRQRGLPRTLAVALIYLA